MPSSIIHKMRWLSVNLNRILLIGSPRCRDYSDLGVHIYIPEVGEVLHHKPGSV